jgi:valyl-tRNA synthetase
MSTSIPSKYNPKEFEDKIYKIWLDENCFRVNLFVFKYSFMEIIKV